MIIDDYWWILMITDTIWTFIFQQMVNNHTIIMVINDTINDAIWWLFWWFFSASPLRSIVDMSPPGKAPLHSRPRSCEGRRRELQGEVVKPMEIAGKSMVFTYGKLEKHSDLEFDWCLNFFKSLFCIVLLFFSLFFSPKTTWWNKRTTSCEQNGQGLSLQWPGVLPFGNLTKLSRITIVNR